MTAFFVRSRKKRKIYLDNTYLYGDGNRKIFLSEDIDRVELFGNLDTNLKLPFNPHLHPKLCGSEIGHVRLSRKMYLEIPEAATAVHGITTRQARERGRRAQDVLEEVARTLAEAMSAGTPVVAFNGSYDFSLLEAELARHGLPGLRERLGRGGGGDGIGPILDPLVLDRAVDRYRRGKRRLGDLCAVYGVRVDESLHTAEVDVAAALDVLEAMVRVHPRLGSMSLEELQGFQVRAHREWAESFNAWLARKNPGRAGADPSWPLAKELRA